MLRPISLFYVIMFIVSCGGEVSRVYHNNPISGGNNSIDNANTAKINCVPGAECNNTNPPTKTDTSNACLPGVECNPSNTNTNTNTNTDTNTSNDTNSSSNDKNKDCVLLPGQTAC